MASRIATHFIGKKVKHEFGVQDPYYEEVVVQGPNGKPVTQRQKRQTPPGISSHDEKILKKLKKRAYSLELFFSLLGFNVGWTAVIGFAPFIGDVINLYLGYGTIQLAEKIDGGLSNWDRSRMMANLALDFGLGLVPFLGDVMQAVYKANTRNVIIAETILRERGQVNISRGGAVPTSGYGAAIETPDGRNHLG